VKTVVAPFTGIYPNGLLPTEGIDYFLNNYYDQLKEFCISYGKKYEFKPPSQKESFRFHLSGSSGPNSNQKGLVENLSPRLIQKDENLKKKKKEKEPAYASYLQDFIAIFNDKSL
jgi:hypothetical protein